MNLSTKNKEIVLLFLLFVITVILRFSQLGYSHYYGDETKALYLRKDISATDFLFNQRKGPVQFLVAWTMEQLTGGYNELTTRLPFALAGTISVFVVYLLAKKLYGRKVAFFSAFLFSLNGFFIAFSRTVQYQSFLWLFGLLAIYVVLIALDQTSTKTKNIYLSVSGALLGLAFLSHWDAVFYAIPVVFLVTRAYLNKKIKLTGIMYIFIPFFAIAAIFYIPYFLNGFYAVNFHNYILRRASGSDQLPSRSVFTFNVYNPYLVGTLLMTYAVFSLKKGLTWKKYFLFSWFIVPFFVFEIIFSNPGTHIQNYIIPLILLAAVGFFTLHNYLFSKNKALGFLNFSVMAVLFVMYLLFQARLYVPALNQGEPWNSIAPLKNKYQMFLYGFPYNRGWDQIREYTKEKSIRSFDTNENVVIGEFYLHGVPATKLVEPQQLPHAYIYIYNNQENKHFSEEKLLEYYDAEMEFFVDGDLSARLYRLRK